MSPPTPPPTEHETRAASLAPEVSAQSTAEVPTEAVTETKAPVQPQPAAAPPSLSQSSRPDHYQRYFPALQAAAAHGQFPELIRLAEAADLVGESERSPTRLLSVVPLVIAYLILDNIPPARHVLIRLSDTINVSLPLIHALHGLLASVRERKHANVYSRTKDLQHAVLQPDFIDAQLGALIADMLNTFLLAFRDRTFILLSRAYTTLGLGLAETYLGMRAEELLPLVTAENWTYDATSQVLTPVPPRRSINKSVTGPSSLATFTSMSDSVGRLEL